MKAIYISGKIDGCDPLVVRMNFFNARQYLHRRFHTTERGKTIFTPLVDPSIISPIPDGSWFDYMMRDLVYLRQCDTIYMLKDWKDSAGARIEHEFAKKLGLEIIYEENERLEQ